MNLRVTPPPSVHDRLEEFRSNRMRNPDLFVVAYGLRDDYGVESIKRANEDGLTEMDLRARFNSQRNARIFTTVLHKDDFERIKVQIKMDSIYAGEILDKQSLTYWDQNGVRAYTPDGKLHEREL